MLVLTPLLLIILSFCAGLLICNAVPHLATGLRGEPLPLLFARPRPGAMTWPQLNVLWGWLNLFAGLAILPRFVLLSPVMPLFNTAWVSFALGFLLAGLYLSWHFGGLRAGPP